MFFTKMQGTGNDFIVVEAKETKRWSKVAMAMCDRHYGIGADGLLLVLPSEKADFRMRIFNSDGSEADACGNGTRCIVKYAIEAGIVDKEEVTLETRKGVRKARVRFKAGQVTSIRVGMGEPRFNPAEIPAEVKVNKANQGTMITCPVTIEGRKLELNLVSMGNPHAVYFTSDPVNDFPLAIVGPKVEHHPMFPDRVNFEVARVVGENRIEARTWERGAGETLACGSGACAVTVASRLNGFTGEKVDIREPGGTLKIEWKGSGEVYLSGPAEAVFTGEWPDD